MWSYRLGYAATIVLAIAESASAIRPNGAPSLPESLGSKYSQAAVSSSVQELNISVPVDHFHNETQYEPHSDDFFPLRYFLEPSHYKPGGPVIVIAAGEASADYRKPLLADSVGALLARATSGLLLVLEHRYYGTSFPVADPSGADYRFLTTEQAVADAAYLARHARFPGLEDRDLTAARTPWILYGGSYAGAFAAIARRLHPDAIWGAISSSGVTRAVLDYWEYNEAARLFAPGDCGPAMANMTHVVDTALFSADGGKAGAVKGLFGAGPEVSDGDFGRGIAHPSSAMQGESWVRGEGDATLERYCATLTSGKLAYPALEGSREAAERLVRDAGLDRESATTLLNYVGLQGGPSEKRRQETRTERRSAQPSDGSSWHYQTCTQWGFFISGSGVPAGTRGILSRAVTLDGVAEGCRRAFGVSGRPDVDSINRLGGVDFSYPRVAVIDGKQDPWRAATPHRIGENAGRRSTTEQPFILVDPATHHWDEYDVPASEYGPGYPPRQIVDVHDQQVAFVKAWVKEFYDSRGGSA